TRSGTPGLGVGPRGASAGLGTSVGISASFLSAQFTAGVARSAPSLAILPVIDVTIGKILGDAMALLNLTFHLITAAANLIQIVVCELAPLRLDLTHYLLPEPSTRFQSIAVLLFICCIEQLHRTGFVQKFLGKRRATPSKAAIVEKLCAASSNY